MPAGFSAPRAPRASQSGIGVVTDTSSLSRLARDLRRASPEAWKACRVALRAAAVPVFKDAQARASTPGSKPGSSPSARVANSMKIVVTSAGNVKIVAGGDYAPDAAAIENKGRGFVRHPVGGNRSVWTAKNSRPAFMAPALEARREQVLREVEAAVMGAVEKAIKGR